MSIRSLRCVLSTAALAALAACLTPAAAQQPQPPGGVAPRSELRVCADPNNLPFSDEKSEGFENKIAELLGKDMALPVRYFWLPQVVGFVRNGLQAGRCDLVMGTVAGDDIMQTTTPYYYTGYMLVFRADKPLSGDLDDPALKALHIGVVAGTPPANLLVRHELMVNARPYALTVDTRYEAPAHQMLLDIASGAIDAGMLWGPFVGYYIKHDHLPLAMVRLREEPGMPRLAYHIAMGVRNNDPDWRRRINSEIIKKRDEITAILRDYGVPLLDERGELIEH
jgi:quinoprotein dehydrogenase-associated probable ABC transporter substrate-binding protein